ncbi:helix-turn-helix domain-containing protein [Streptomyces microflavus]|uniref:helix-turn-helix domain-containing protein n=1 Tax=Streptomyces microflavus TaxID=1919 RepID=UPI00365320DE
MYGDLWENGVDMAAVERAALMREKCPPLSPQEQRRAVGLMAERGITDKTIGIRLGLSQQTVFRWRTQTGPAA